MPDWWSYSLSDFLLFSPRTYYRLIERYNAALWPSHIVTLGLGAVILALLRWPVRWQGRAISAIVAVLWAWVAWAFLRERYATINWAASYFAWGFAVEVVMLLWIGVVRGGLSFRLRRDVEGLAGIALLVLSVLLYPAFAPTLGRGWEQAEVFGMMPDPTAVATLGLLLLVPGRRRWELLAVPVLWCLVSAATLYTLGAPEWWLLGLAPMLTVLVSASVTLSGAKGA